MKSKIRHKEECSKVFEIVIPFEDVARAAEEIYREIKKVAKIPGFRPGTAPRDLLEKHYSDRANEEILKKLVPDGYREAVKTHRVAPIGVPHITKISLEKNRPLTFEAHVDTKPNIKLKNYRRIKVKKKRISVSGEEVEEAISRIRNMQARYNSVERPVQKGDYAICDVEAFIDGKPISKKHENMWVMADKDASLLGMGEKLAGLKKNDSKEIEATLPANYPDKKYAGKKADFKILVKEVREKELPPLDGKLARTLGADTVEALKKEIESQLFNRKETSLRIDMQNQILEYLLRGHRFAVPSGIVERQKEYFKKRLERELLQNKMPKSGVEKKIKEMDSKLAEDAANKVRLYFILDEIALKEKVEVSEKEIDERIRNIALSVNQKYEDVKKRYTDENLLGGLAEEIKEAKVLDLLLKEADITEAK